MTIIIAALLLGLLRAATKVITNISFAADNWYFSVIDLTFVLICGYWFYNLFKGSKWFKLFYVAVLVSIPIFRFQEGFTIILVFLPFLAVFYKHKNQLESKGVKELFLGFVKIGVYPFYLVISLIERVIFELKNKKASALPSYGIYILIGTVVGGLILVVLYNLDPEFKKWLSNIEPIIDTIRYTFGVFAVYIALFLWFFYGPISITLPIQEDTSNINTILKFASLIITAIIVGYVLYDAYIILRMVGVMSLVFESVGKNTQMYFLEMVILGGIFTYIVGLLLDKINADASVNSHKKVLRNLLIFALFFLLPPLINVLRALLLVYVPEYGLTVRRLFGTYVTVSLLVAFIFIVYKSIKHETKIFLNSVLVFFVMLFALSFYVPNSLLIFNWHFNKYIQNQESVDYIYMLNLNVGKWGFLFDNKLQPQQYPKDTLLLWKIESDKQHKIKAREYRDLFLKQLNNEVSDVSKLLENQDFSTLYSKYLYKNFNYLLIFEQLPNLSIDVIEKNNIIKPLYDKNIYTNNYFTTYSKYSGKEIYMYGLDVTPNLTVNVNYIGNYTGINGKRNYLDKQNINLNIVALNGKRSDTFLSLSELVPIWIKTKGKDVDKVSNNDILLELCSYAPNPLTSTSTRSVSQCKIELKGILENNKVPPLPQEAIDYFFLGPKQQDYYLYQDKNTREQYVVSEELNEYILENRENLDEDYDKFEPVPTTAPIITPTPQVTIDGL